MPGKEAGVFEEGEGVVVETGRWGSPKIPEAPTGNYRFEDVVWPGPIRSDGGEDSDVPGDADDRDYVIDKRARRHVPEDVRRASGRGRPLLEAGLPWPELPGPSSKRCSRRRCVNKQSGPPGERP
ncbi:hypothetical protein MTO96_023597 [Rhipicephalus appendiculatus]